MIRRLRLSNFQAHSASQLDFAPGVNVVTGPSDQGKSSVIRALVWALFNKPGGDGHCKDGTDTTAVHVVMDNCTIIRRRDKKGNTYKLSMNGVTTEFAALRSDVPHDIADAVNILPFQIQQQHENHFLLQESPGAVATQLNRLVGLELDTIFQRAGRMISSAKAAETAATAQAEELERDLAAYSSLDTIEALVEELEATETRGAQAGAQAQKLRAAIRTADAAQAELDKHVDTDKAEEAIKDLDALLGTLRQKEEEADRIYAAANAVAEAEEGMAAATQEAAAKDADLARVKTELGVCPMCDKPF